MDTNQVPMFVTQGKGELHPDDPSLETVQAEALRRLEADGEDAARQYVWLLFCGVVLRERLGERTKDQAVAFAEGMLWMLRRIDVETTGVMRHDA